jgi:glycosyltransferase involved in cell wall biosynthesis
MNQISFIITSPYYDSGIKSIGSKSIYSVKKNTTIEKQYRSILKYCQNKEYEIIFVNSVDHHKTSKFLDKKQLNIQYVFLNKKNINHAGCFLKGLELAKYDTVCIIDSGLIISPEAISKMIDDNIRSDINIGCVGNKHKQNLDLDTGCIVANDSDISNIFFGLDNKYIGISCINSHSKNFLLEHCNIDSDKNKFMFELINICISKNFVCKKTELKSKDTYLIFSKKSLQQYAGL